MGIRKRTVLEAVLVLSLAVVVLAAQVVPALAEVTYNGHIGVSGVTLIGIAGHPPIMVYVLHYDRGIYGPADFLEVDTQQNIPGCGLVCALRLSYRTAINS
jgi:hypothetical protein